MIGGLLPPVVAHLIAETGEFTAKMGEAEALTKRVTGAAGASWAQAGKAAMGVGTVMAGAALMVGMHTIHMASDFNSQMEKVHTQAGASQREVDSLKQKVIDLGAATGQGPANLAEALYHVESVGYRGATAMAVLNNASKLASISGANLDETTYGLTSVMQTYGAKAQDAAKWAAFFNSVVGAGDMKMEDFNKAVGTGYFSAAQTFGMSSQSAGAALAFMTDRGQHADAAATNLRMSLALIAAPSQKATTILKSMGLTAEDVAKGHAKVNGVLERSKVTYSQLAGDLKKPDGFVVALSHLKKGLMDSGLSAEAANAQLSHAFGGGKSDSTILAMLNNLDTLKQKYAAVGHGMGSFAESYKKSAETAKGQMDRMKASASGLGIEIGNALMPYFLKFLGWVKTGTDFLRTHSWAVKLLAGLIGVTLVSGLALATAGAIAFAIATSELWLPILGIIAVVMLVVTAIILLWTHWKQIWGWIVDRAKAVAGWLADVWHSIKNKASEVWGEMMQWIRDQWDGISSWFSGKWHTVSDAVGKAWKAVTDTTTRIWNGIVAFFKKWWPLLLIVFAPFIALLVGLWNHFHTQITTGLHKAWNAVVTFLKGVWKWITEHASSAWQTFYENVVAPVQRAVHRVSDMVRFLAGRVRDAFHDAITWVKQRWDSFYKTVIQPVQDVANHIGGIMQRIWKSITSWFTTTYNDIVATVKGWWRIGGAIVDGIINGIEQKARDAWNTVVDFANNLLQSAMSALGVNSPSKVFRDTIGKAIPEGVAVGVDLHTRVATGGIARMAAKLRAAGQIAMATTPALAVSSSAMSAVSSSSLNTIHAHVQVVAKVDGKVLFETQQEHALQYQRRNSTPAFATS